MFKNSYSQSRIIKKDEKIYVQKCYMTIFGIKWYFISTFFWNYPYVADPKERFVRELDFFLDNTWKDIVIVPKLIDIDAKELCITREFIEGNEINEENIEIVAKGLREIHEVGYVLGDTKISNFVIVNRSKLAVIDAEQSFKSNNVYYRAWDLVVFFLFLSYKMVNINHFQEVAKRFLDEYMPDKSIAKEFFDIKNINLMGLYPPTHLYILKNLMSNFY
ncbi:MAG: serine/threonine protein kinase [Saccharolobus sp.]|uniref:serine/threonine protein kinase n=1 Tax=Saccharolobus TaxID=2100760 RepID=UPI001F0EFAEF|nr:serine/threonine protein kinase [Saccharolobus shibatae]MCH4814542.1 serine/threonine protein kinase [Saccharolobus shibatae]